jgi:VWFA-related protein
MSAWSSSRRPSGLRTIRRAQALRLLLVLSVVAAPTAQTPQTTFRAKTDLVRIEVVVVDEQGKPVRDLKQEDFTLLDRKKPQPIALFDAVSGTSKPAPVPIRHTAPPRDVATNASAQASTFIILVLDDMVVRRYYDQTRALAREIVDRFGRSSVMAMLVTSGTDGVEATDDPAPILAAIDRLGAKSDRVPEGMGDQTSRPTLAEKLRTEYLGGTPDNGLKDDDGCHLTLLKQAGLMAIADDVPRKVLIYITPFCGDPTGQNLDTAALQATGFFMPPRQTAWLEMVDTLRRANVAVYALDPRGTLGYNVDQIRSTDIVSGTDPAGRNITTRSFAPVWQSQEGLRSLTGLTGGFAVTNSDDFDSGLAELSQDLNDFYILGFYPPGGRKGEFRAIDVQVNRPGATVRFRTGYVSGDGPNLKTSKDPLVSLSAGALPTGDLPLSLFASAWPSQSGDKPVLVVVEMTVSRAELKTTPTGFQDEVDVAILAAKTPGAKLVRHTQSHRQVDIARTSKESVTYQVSTVIDLPTDSYQLRVSAKSATGRSGSVYLSVNVPDPVAPRFALGGIVMGYVDGAHGVSATAANARSKLPFSPTLARSFVSTDALHVLCKLWRRNPAEPVQMRAELVAEDGHVVRGLQAPVRVGRGALPTENIDFTLNLRGVAPGAYRLRIIASERGVNDMREVGIDVRGS